MVIQTSSLLLSQFADEHDLAARSEIGPCSVQENCHEFTIAEVVNIVANRA
jgi:hypothetical protein